MSLHATFEFGAGRPSDATVTLRACPPHELECLRDRPLFPALVLRRDPDPAAEVVVRTVLLWSVLIEESRSPARHSLFKRCQRCPPEHVIAFRRYESNHDPGATPTPPSGAPIQFGVPVPGFITGDAKEDVATLATLAGLTNEEAFLTGRCEPGEQITNNAHLYPRGPPRPQTVLPVVAYGSLEGSTPRYFDISLGCASFFHDGRRFHVLVQVVALKADGSVASSTVATTPPLHVVCKFLDKLTNTKDIYFFPRFLKKSGGRAVVAAEEEPNSASYYIEGTSVTGGGAGAVHAPMLPALIQAPMSQSFRLRPHMGGAALLTPTGGGALNLTALNGSVLNVPGPAATARGGKRPRWQLEADSHDGTATFEPARKRRAPAAKAAAQPAPPPPQQTHVVVAPMSAPLPPPQAMMNGGLIHHAMGPGMGAMAAAPVGSPLVHLVGPPVGTVQQLPSLGMDGLPRLPLPPPHPHPMNGVGPEGPSQDVRGRVHYEGQAAFRRLTDPYQRQY